MSVMWPKDAEGALESATSFGMFWRIIRTHGKACKKVHHPTVIRLHPTKPKATESSDELCASTFLEASRCRGRHDVQEGSENKTGTGDCEEPKAQSVEITKLDDRQLTLKL